MKLKKKDWKTISQALISLSVLAVVAAGWGFLVSDIWLASTQWLLVAAVLAVFGLYSRLES
jgi:fatty acid desaturase